MKNQNLATRVSICLGLLLPHIGMAQQTTLPVVADASHSSAGYTFPAFKVRLLDYVDRAAGAEPAA